MCLFKHALQMRLMFCMRYLWLLPFTINTTQKTATPRLIIHVQCCVYYYADKSHRTEVDHCPKLTMLFA